MTTKRDKLPLLAAVFDEPFTATSGCEFGRSQGVGEPKRTIRQPMSDTWFLFPACSTITGKMHMPAPTMRRAFATGLRVLADAVEWGAATLADEAMAGVTDDDVSAALDVIALDVIAVDLAGQPGPSNLRALAHGARAELAERLSAIFVALVDEDIDAAAEAAAATKSDSTAEALIGRR